MEEIKTLSNSIIVKDGAQGIVLIGGSSNPLYQKYVMVRDFNDRGRGDGKKMYGLPGGAIELGEEPKDAILRELYEEIAFDIKEKGFFSFEKFGCYSKLRPNGFTNNNHLFVFRLGYLKIKTNDPSEVSSVCIFRLYDIINLANYWLIHEGSIRLIFNYLNRKNFGSLNESVTFNGFTF